MLRSSFCDYSDPYILIKGTITVENTAAQDQLSNTANKKVILKNCLPFTKCITIINNAQIDDGHDIDIVMPVYNVIKQIDN